MSADPDHDTSVFLEQTVQRLEHLQPVYGAEALNLSTQAWLQSQAARCSDMAWAARFAQAQSATGRPPEDFLQRIVPVGAARILAGIRFQAGDTARAFVDVLAWTGAADWPAIAGALADAWAMFRPARLRVLMAAPPTGLSADLDQSVHVARAADMAADMPAAEDGPAQLDPVCAPADAAAMVAGVYAAVIAGDPAFAGELYAAGESDLAQCQDEGTLHWIVADGARAGVIASQPGDVEMLPGHVIVEEAVLPAFRGRGLAAAAQRRLAGILAGQAADAVITGTIFAGNAASRRTAERAGRPALLNYWFALLAAG